LRDAAAWQIYGEACVSCSTRVFKKTAPTVFVKKNKSLLLWYIATDLCFYRPDATPTSESAAASRVISNYMAYLLLLRPDMLIPGTNTNGFTLACYDLEAMLPFDEEPPLHEKELP
jgi:hypothetical protein